MQGILIGTAVLWILNALFVVPLATRSLTQKMAAARLTPESLETASEADRRHWARVATASYILWDVVILGLAGVIGGLLGFFFVGISFEAKGWPGMIAFILASLIGSSLG